MSKGSEREKIILYVLIGLCVGFIAGAVTGIWYTTKDVQKRTMQAMPQDGSSSGVSLENVKHLEGILKKEPNNLEAIIALGNTYFDGGEPAKAIEMYRRALKIDAKNADVRTDMAIMYRALKEYDKAVEELKIAMTHDPRHANSRFNLGIILLHDKGDMKGAIAAWEDYLKVNPSGEQAEMVRKQLEQLRLQSK